MNLWLKPIFFTWNYDPLRPGTSQDLDFLKPYDLLRHARKKLDDVNDKENTENEKPELGEVVYQLKRAIEHRERKLANRFNFSELPIDVPSINKKPRIYERLYELGIVQPILYRKLNDLRNLITHEQKDPLTKDKPLIEELFEFTWYFIRSTDSFLGRYVSGIVFYPPDDTEPDSAEFFDEEEYSLYEHDESQKYKGCFLVEISPHKKWRVNIKGYEVPISLFSKQEKKNWLEIIIEDFDDLSEKRDIDPELLTKLLLAALDEQIDGQKEPEVDKDIARKKRFDEYSSSGNLINKFEGILVAPSIFIDYAIKAYFELYMYY
jgi:hypothetical protein